MKYIFIIIGLLFTFSLVAQNDENITTLELEEKRYYNSLAFDFNMGGSSATSYKSGLGFRYAAGYKMNRWLNFGGGIGFEFLNFGRNSTICGIVGCDTYYGSNNLFIPLYAEVRGELAEWKVKPFYQVELGMGFKVKGENDNLDNRPKGVYFRPQMGWKFKGKNDCASSIGFGYLLQTSRENRDNSWGEDVYLEKKKRTYQRYFIQFGFEF